MMCPGWKRQLQCSASIPTETGFAAGCTRWWFWIAAGVAAIAGSRRRK